MGPFGALLYRVQQLPFQGLQFVFAAEFQAEHILHIERINHLFAISRDHRAGNIDVAGCQGPALEVGKSFAINRLR